MRSKLRAHIWMPSKGRKNSCKVESQLPYVDLGAVTLNNRSEDEQTPSQRITKLIEAMPCQQSVSMVYILTTVYR